MAYPPHIRLHWVVYPKPKVHSFIKELLNLSLNFCWTIWSFNGFRNEFPWWVMTWELSILQCLGFALYLLRIQSIFKSHWPSQLYWIVFCICCTCVVNNLLSRILDLDTYILSYCGNMMLVNCSVVQILYQCEMQILKGGLFKTDIYSEI